MQSLFKMHKGILLLEDQVHMKQQWGLTLASSRMTGLTSCFVHIRWLRERCMADSVARRPHTATSVRGLISPPSPILVVWLRFTVFRSSPPRTCLHLLIPFTLIFPASISPSISLSRVLCFPPNHIYLQPRWSLSDSPFIGFPHFLPCPLPISLPLPRSLLLSSCVHLKLLILLLSVSLCPLAASSLSLSSSLRLILNSIPVSGSSAAVGSSYDTVRWWAEMAAVLRRNWINSSICAVS